MPASNRIVSGSSTAALAIPSSLDGAVITADSGINWVSNADCGNSGLLSTDHSFSLRLRRNDVAFALNQLSALQHTPETLPSVP